MTTPTLDEALIAFAVARKDLQEVEDLASKAFSHLEDLQRRVREKRSLVSRLRTEVTGLILPGKEGAA